MSVSRWKRRMACWCRCIRNADNRRLKDLVRRYNELVELARQRKLPGDATGGSIATVTNFGTFGLTGPRRFRLPEQTLVLGLGAGRKCRAGTRTRAIRPGDRSQPDAEF